MRSQLRKHGSAISRSMCALRSHFLAPSATGASCLVGLHEERMRALNFFYSGSVQQQGLPRKGRSQSAARQMQRKSSHSAISSGTKNPQPEPWVY